MPDRFQETGTDARAAIERAVRRREAARRRRLELADRLVALARPHPHYESGSPPTQATVARMRLLLAERSSERARVRASRAYARSRQI